MLEDWEISDILEGINDEVEWLRFHDDAYIEAIDVRRSTDCDKMDKAYANIIISEYQKTIYRIRNRLYILNGVELSDSRNKLINEWKNFISNQIALLNGRRN